jgi:hypothetical protein
MNRRDFLHAGCTVAAASLIPSIVDRAEASFHHGSVVASNPNPLASQRSGMNIRTTETNEYLFINHFKLAQNGPLQPNGSSPAVPFSTIINSQGWPISGISTFGYNGGGLRLPNTADYGASAGETYTIDPGPTGIGDCEFTFNLGSWVMDASSVNVTQIGGVGAGHFKTTTNGVAWKLVVTVNGLTSIVPGVSGFFNLIALNFVNMPASANLTDFRIYRTGDAARLATGKLFRAPALQPIVDLNPSYVRFMDWVGGNDDQNCRWENRCKPDHGTYKGDFSGSPAYGNADYAAYSGSGPGTVQQYTLGAAAGTTGNPSTTPVAMTHGEVAICGVITGLVRAGTATISTISVGATPTVTCTGSHPFVTGDIVYPNINTADGMQQLDRRRCQVTVTGPTTFTIDVPTTGFTTFTNNTGQSKFNFFVSLNVGTRGAYPVVWSSGFVIAGGFNGIGEMQSNTLVTFWFDKNVTPCKDASGTVIQGAWLFSPGTSPGLPNANWGMPIEVCTKFILEVNELSVAQGITNPIHMWLNVPFRGMLSIDPDYSSASNFATKMVDVALNGSTVNGITYPGLKSVNGPSLLLEHSNETWNTGGADSQAVLSQAYAQAVVGKDNYNETAGYSSWRSVAMVQDVKAAFPSETRLKFVLASIGTNVGIAEAYMYATGGTTYYTNQKLGGWPTFPITAHDAFAIAPYLEPFSGGNFTVSYNDTFLDTISKYFGVDSSGALNITVNASTTNQIVTTAVTNGPVVVNQRIVGAGIPPNTFVTVVAGVSPNYTLTLSNTVNTPSGAKLSSAVILTVNSISSSSTMVSTASNVWLDNTMLNATILGAGGNINTIFATVSAGGITGTFPNYTIHLDHAITFAGGTVTFYNSVFGDYRGAVNQSGALQDFVDAVRGVAPVDTTNETVNRYCNPAAPTAGVEAGYVAHTGFGSAGKVLIHYEGGPNWGVGNPINRDPGSVFLYAANQSSQWATAEINYFNARATQTGMAMPGVFGWISDFGQWSYAVPDNYASHIEGQNLKNTAFWPALGARNKALTI